MKEAVSNTKCDSRVDNNPLPGAVFNEGFSGPAPAKRFSRSPIQVQRDRIKLSLRELRQVCSFGQKLAQQSVGDLADTPLPRAMRVVWPLHLRTPPHT
jgi:hypothetical protein